MVARLLRFLILPLAVGAPLVAIGVACNEDSGLACHADTDCPTGSICRDSVCGLTNPDAGAGIDAYDNSDFDSGDTSCSEDGTQCTIAAECCSGQCVESICAEESTVSETCKSVYELCEDDCCTGLSCINGACR